jgi:Tol biopolymer transport system component
VARLTDNPALDYNPGWSPDGSRIVFTSDGAGNRELCAMNADGTGLFNITSHPANDWAADWGP